jgi:uncharacterized repeat protein (TIGR01451 family)
LADLGLSLRYDPSVFGDGFEVTSAAASPRQALSLAFGLSIVSMGDDGLVAAIDAPPTGAVTDVRVRKTLLTTGTLMVGQMVDFRVVVSNAGPFPASGISLLDSYRGLSYASDDCASTAFGGAPMDRARRIGIGMLDSGAERECVLTFQITALPASNAVSANVLASDLDASNNRDRVMLP